MFFKEFQISESTTCNMFIQTLTYMIQLSELNNSIVSLDNSASLTFPPPFYSETIQTGFYKGNEFRQQGGRYIKIKTKKYETI